MSGPRACSRATAMALPPKRVRNDRAHSCSVAGVCLSGSCSRLPLLRSRSETGMLLIGPVDRDEGCIFFHLRHLRKLSCWGRLGNMRRLLCESVIVESSWLTTTEYSLVRQGSTRGCEVVVSSGGRRC